jgi:hypothetical protein
MDWADAGSTRPAAIVAPTTNLILVFMITVSLSVGNAAVSEKYPGDHQVYRLRAPREDKSPKERV